MQRDDSSSNFAQEAYNSKKQRGKKREGGGNRKGKKGQQNYQNRQNTALAFQPIS